MHGDFLIAFLAIIGAQVVIWLAGKLRPVIIRGYHFLRGLRVVSAERMRDLEDKEAALQAIDQARLLLRARAQDTREVGNGRS